MSVKLKILRVQAQLTLEDLAVASGLTRSYVSKIERGVSTPSISAALKLAQALGLSVEALFGDLPGDDPVSITRRAERSLAADTSGASVLVTGNTAGHRMLAFELTPAEAGERGHPMSRHTGEEMLYVLAGVVNLKLAHRNETLEAGDCAHFSAAVPHRITRLGDAPARVLVVILPDNPNGAAAAAAAAEIDLGDDPGVDAVVRPPARSAPAARPAIAPAPAAPARPGTRAARR